jgi:hypothetical protein
VKTSEPERKTTLLTRLSFVASSVAVPGWAAFGGVVKVLIAGVNGSDSVTVAGGVPTVFTTCATFELASSTPAYHCVAVAVIDWAGTTEEE